MPRPFAQEFVFLYIAYIKSAFVKPNRISTLYRLLLFAVLLTACEARQHRNIPETKPCFQQHKLTAAQESAIRKEIHADAKAARLDSLFKKKHSRQGFNGTVLIAQKGVIVYEGAFGYCDVKSKTPLVLNNAFQLASVSKTFTGVSILMMAQEGKLNMSDSIQQYLPGFPYHGITIENLLSHRSGLPNYLYAFENKRKLNGAPPTNDTILKWFIEANPLPAPYNKPGKSFSYNNSNFVILSCILEKVSDMSYADFLRTRIFEPLDMQHSYVDTIAPDSILQLRTCGHNGTRIAKRDFYDGVYGDKGVYSTVEDMAKWYFALQNNCLLNDYWLKQAFKPRSFENKSRHNYGLGFRLMTNTTNMHRVEYIYHSGWWMGYSTMFWCSPADDYAIIVLGNRRNFSVYDIKPIISILEGGKKAADLAPDDATDTL